MKINILGTKYKILIREELQDVKLEGLNGYCDITTKEIVIRNFKKIEDPKVLGNLEELYKTTLRHEIIHAFLYESGLYASSNDIEAWATNEEMVDWLAIQFPKIIKVFIEANAL